MRRRTASALLPPDLYVSTASTTLDVSLFNGNGINETINLHTDHKIAYLRYIAALSMKATKALSKTICDLNLGEENEGTFGGETISHPIGPP